MREPRSGKKGAGAGRGHVPPSARIGEMFPETRQHSQNLDCNVRNTFFESGPAGGGNDGAGAPGDLPRLHESFEVWERRHGQAGLRCCGGRVVGPTVGQNCVVTLRKRRQRRVEGEANRLVGFATRSFAIKGRDGEGGRCGKEAQPRPKLGEGPEAVESEGRRLKGTV